MDRMDKLAVMEEWQQQRQRAGADPYDWTAFRGYVLEQHHHDPGVAPVAVFLAFEAEDGKATPKDREVEAVVATAAGLEKTQSE